MTTIYTVNNKVLKNSANDKWLIKKAGDPYNPLGLPAGVMRMKMADGWTLGSYDPSSLEFTQVSSSPNVWDMKVKNGSGISNWTIGSNNIIEIMGFNPEGVTGYNSGIRNIMGSTTTKIGAMRLPEVTALDSYSFSSTIEEVGPLSIPNANSIAAAFQGRQQLRYVVLNDLANVENCVSAFSYCYALTSMPILNGLVKVTNAESMFYNSLNIGSGILDMYNTLNAMGTVTNHSDTFYQCGRDSVTGAAELAQIPSSWGGTGA